MNYGHHQHQGPGLRRLERQRFALLMTVVALAAAILYFGPAGMATAAAPRTADGLIEPPTSTSFANLIEAVKPAVVNISASRNPEPRSGGRSFNPSLPPGTPFDELFRRFFDTPGSHGGPHAQPAPQQALGSGFIINADGIVITNNHVISGADEITVTLDDGSQYPAKVIGLDHKTDLAVLEISSDQPLPYVAFGDSDRARVGDWVLAIGNPFGLGGTATTGIISARGRDIQAGPFDDFLQIDAPINSGNSGGPLFDLSGRVIGINTAIFTPNGGNVGIGFAIPSDLAGPIVDQLRENGRVERGWLGVGIQQLDDDIAESLGLESQEGALVTEVVPSSPAERSGLRAGDVILSFADEPVTEIKDLTRLAAAAQAGDSVEIAVWRDGETVDIDLEVGSSPDDPEEARISAHSDTPELGLSLVPLSADSRQRLRIADDFDGVLISSVDPSAAAAEKGLRAGDIIVLAGQTSVTKPADVATEVEKTRAAGRSSVLLQIYRQGATRFVALPLAD